MDKKKILFHIHTLTKGVAEISIINLAKQFNDSGNEVIIVTSIKCESEYEVPSGVKRIILSDKDNNGLGNPFNRMVGLGLKLRGHVKKEKPDVVIAFISGSIVRSVVATFGLKTKVIASVRNDPSFEYKGRMGQWIVKYIFPKVDGFVFQTQLAKQYFSKKIQDKSTVITNSVNPTFYEVKRNPIKHRVVNCGRLDAQKNQRMLIDAFSIVAKKIEDAELHIYGKGPEYDNLNEQILELGLKERCFLKGETSDIPRVMEEADVFVLSSDFEGMPNVLIEALTSGVPSISTDCPCGGPAELIVDGENGILIRVKDTNQLVSALSNLLDDDELKNRLSLNSKNSSTMFDPKRIYNQWNCFIHKVLA